MRALLTVLALVAVVPSPASAFPDWTGTTARGGELAGELGYGWGPLHASESGPSGDAIDLYNGAVWLSSPDVFLPGPRGLDLLLTRSYSSHRARADEYLSDFLYPEQTGWLGRGWMLTAGYAWVRTDAQGGVSFFHDGYVTLDGVVGSRLLGSTMGVDDTVTSWDPLWAPGDTPSVVGLPTPAGLHGQDPAQPEVALLEDGSWLYFTPTGLGLVTRTGLVYLLDQVSLATSAPFALGDGTVQEAMYSVTEVRTRFGDSVTYTYGAGAQLVSADASWTSLSPDVSLTTTNGALESVSWPGPQGTLTRTYTVDPVTVDGVMAMPSTAPACDCAEAPGTSTLQVPVLSAVTEPGGLTTQYDYVVEEVAGVELTGRVYPSPAAPQAVALKYMALQTITEPTGLVTTLGYAPETFFIQSQPSCCLASGGDGSEPFAWRSRLAATSRTVSIGSQSLSWAIARPASPADTFVPLDSCTSCGISVREQTWLDEPELDDERTVVVTDPHGILRTYSFEQRDAGWAFGDQAGSVAACAATTSSTCGVVQPTLPSDSLLREQLLTYTEADSGGVFYEELHTYNLWMPTTFVSGVPRPASRTVYYDGQVGPALVETFDPPDGYGRIAGVDSWISTPAGGSELTSTVTAFAPVHPAWEAWNLVDLPAAEQSWLNGVPTGDRILEWGVSGAALGRLDTEISYPSAAAGTGSEVQYDYVDDLGDGTTLVETTIPVSPVALQAEEVVGPGGLVSLTIGGEALVTSLYAVGGEPLTRVDERGLSQTWSYEPATGRQASTTVSAGTQILRDDVYDWSGWPAELTTTDMDGLVTVTEYDALGRATSLEQQANAIPLGSAPAQTSLSWSYDDAGRSALATGPAAPGGPHTRSSSRDARGRIEALSTAGPQLGDHSVTYPQTTESVLSRTVGGSRSYAASRAADGSLRGLVDSANQDCAQWSPTSQGPSPGMPGGQVGSFLALGACSPTGSADRVLTTTMDATGAVAGTSDTGRGYAEAQNDDAGRPVTLITPSGAMSLEYDAVRGQLESMSKGGQSITVQYGVSGGGKGLPEVITSGAEFTQNSVTFDYFAGGLLKSAQWSEQYEDSEVDLYPSDLVADHTTSYTLDGNGRLASVVYSDGSTASYTYDSQGRTASISYAAMDPSTGLLEPAQPIVTQTAYSHWGDPQYRAYGNGIVEDWTFDGAGRATGGEISGIPPLVGEASGARSPGSYMQSLTWDVQNLGAVSRTLPDGTTESSVLSWDARDRLTGATSVGGSATWAWGWTDQDDLQLRSTGGENGALDATELSWVANRPSGGDYVLDGDRGVLTQAGGYTFSFDAWGRATLAEGYYQAASAIAARGVEAGEDTLGIEVAYAYNAMGQLAIEYRNDTAQGRWYRYGPGGELLERWSWVAPNPAQPYVGAWELDTRYILDPTTGTVVGAWLAPAGTSGAPACPEVVESAIESDYVALSWSPVPGVAGYAIYRDGVAHKYTEPGELYLNDFTVRNNTTYAYEVRPLGVGGSEASGCGEEWVSFGEGSHTLTWDPSPDPNAYRYTIEGCLADAWSGGACNPPEPYVKLADGVGVGSEEWTFDATNGFSAGFQRFVRVYVTDTAGNVSPPSDWYDLWEDANGSDSPPSAAPGPTLVTVVTDALGQDVLLVDAASGSPAYYGMSRRAPDGSILLGSAVGAMFGFDPGLERELSLAPNLLVGAAGPVDAVTQEGINGWSVAGHATMGLGVGVGVGGGAMAAFLLGSNPIGWTILAGGLLVGGGSAFMARMGDGYDVGVSAPGKAAALAAGDMLIVGGVVEGVRGKNSMNGRQLSSSQREAAIGGSIGALGTLGMFAGSGMLVRGVQRTVSQAVADGVTAGATEAMAGLARGPAFGGMGAGGYQGGHLGRLVGEYDAAIPGPLGDSHAGTFAGGRYSEVVLRSDTILHRAGTAKHPLGQFFSEDRPRGILQARIDKAVRPIWPGGATSPIDTAFSVRFPAGTSVFVGETGSQGGVYVGGTQQIFIRQPWLMDGVRVVGSTPLH